MEKREVKIVNPTGLHLRPAGQLCSEAMKYKSRITFYNKNTESNAKSVLSILGACVKCGDTITLVCDGEDEKEAIDALSAYINERLGE